MVGFGSQQNCNDGREFYSENIGRPVNLFTASGTTYSGDLKNYDPDKGDITLINSIQRAYSREGVSSFIESENPFTIKESIIVGKIRATREDRLGRIAQYNRDLQVERLEQIAKLENLSQPKDRLNVISLK